jgi:uncharacterized protein
MEAETPSDDKGCARSGVLPPTVSTVRPRLQARLGSEPDVVFAYLFGSVAKGTSRERSDVDVAVWVEAGGVGDAKEAFRVAERALELEGVLEAELRRPVQVVVLNTAPIELVHNVLRHGSLICSREEAARVRFYVDHARRYYDLEPARAIFDRAMARRIEEGRFGG